MPGDAEPAAAAAPPNVVNKRRRRRTVHLLRMVASDAVVAPGQVLWHPSGK